MNTLSRWSKIHGPKKTKYMVVWENNNNNNNPCLFSNGQRTIFSHFKSLRLLTMTLRTWNSTIIHGMPAMYQELCQKIWHPHSISQQSIGVDRHGEYLIHFCLCGNWQSSPLFCQLSVLCGSPTQPVDFLCHYQHPLKLCAADSRQKWVSKRFFTLPAYLDSQTGKIALQYI